MFLITEGPAIFYVDPDAMELKGTISWFVQLVTRTCREDFFLIRTTDLRIEQKDMKTFLIHVVCTRIIYWKDDSHERFFFDPYFQPGRTYHLTDPEQNATTWCKGLTSIHYRYYNTDPSRKLSTGTSYSSASSSLLQPAVPVTELWLSTQRRRKIKNSTSVPSHCFFFSIFCVDLQ